ncbi:serine hydrolase domain-containing protein [Bacteroidota bacterium]
MINSRFSHLLKVCITALVVFTAFFINSCYKEAETFFPNAEENGLDAQLLFQAVELAEQDSGILSLIVYRNNDIIVEEYFGKGGADSLHKVKSVTKSVTSILVGMAMDQGYISSLDETVADYLSDYLTPEDSIVARVTIRELLTMSGGFDWNELTDPDWVYWNNWVRSDDHFLYALHVPIIHEPGTQFTYCTTGCQIISGLFTEATGYTLKAFAEEFLFASLGIVGDRPWGADHHDFNYGGVTLQLKAMDMLKIGKLYLNEGEYIGQQVVPKEWVVSSTSAQIGTDVMYSADHYGYYWWIGEKEGVQYYYANGFGGQFIFVFPELEMLVIAQSELNNAYHDPGQQWMNTINLIMNEIFSTVL